MPVMSRREGETDSGESGGEARPPAGADRALSAGSNALHSTGTGKSDSIAVVERAEHTEADNTGVLVESPPDHSGGMAEVVPVTISRGDNTSETTPPGAAEEHQDPQAHLHGNGDAVEATDQGVNKGVEHEGRGAEEGVHVVEGEPDTDPAAGVVAMEGEEGALEPTAPAATQKGGGSVSAAVGGGETNMDNVAAQELHQGDGAADGDSDTGNHGNVDGERPSHLTEPAAEPTDNPESVINVEIRPKSSRSHHAPNNGHDTGSPRPAGTGVAPEVQPFSSFPTSIHDTTNTDAKTSQNNNNHNGPHITNSHHNHGAPQTSTTQITKGPPKRKKMKKGIFISYSPDAGFVERKFVVECVRQFKEINLAEDIWFDKDEKNIDSPCWFSHRLEAAERCRATVLFLSESYFHCAVSVYELKTLLERHRNDPNAVRIFPVLFSNGEDVDVPRQFAKFITSNCVNLTGTAHLKKSLAERASVVVGALIIELEKIASINAPPAPFTPPDTEFSGEYRKKKICHWGANDLQEWLFKLGVKEFYRQSLAENMVDGYLLLATTDQDMVTYLAIDSRIVRKKITQQVLSTLEKENKQPDTWHIRAKAQRPRPNSIYLIYDPSDIRLAQNLKHDLTKKGLQVLHHQKLGSSKEEFLQQNGPVMAHVSFVLVILTDAATTSPFVFHEVIFAEWLGKKVITAMFKNTWQSLRPSLKAVMGDAPAVDFETKMYQESMDILEHHIKPLRAVPGVVLEQTYLNKMSEGIRPLSVLANQLRPRGGALEALPDGSNTARVFISFQWDMASRVEDIRHVLESAGFTCWADIGTSVGLMSPGSGPHRGNSGVSSRSGVGSSGVGLGLHLGGGSGEPTPESLNTQIQRNMKASSVVVCCVTPKYMQSDNCVKDLTLAENLRKVIVPVMLRFCPWPPESAPTPVRKILVKYAPVDLSNDKLYRQNMAVLLDRVKRCTGLK